MTSIVTRTGKGTPLTISELDANFTNLNTDKVEKTRIVGAAAGELTVTNGGALNNDIELGLPNTGITAGTINNSATQLTPVALDAKGRVVGVSTPVTITPQFSSLTNVPSTLAGYGITDAQTAVVGGATTITDDDLTASRALVSDVNGKVAASGVSATELGYLQGLGQNAQSQLDGKQSTSEKDQANGYAGLNASGKLSDAVIPDLAISEYLGAVADEAEMLALTGQKGDWCTRDDAGTIFVITGNPATVGGWMQMAYPGTPVKSVAGKTGIVTLDKTDVGLSALTNDAQLKIASNLSDLNDAATARTNLGLGNVDNTSDATKNSATATLTNKTLTLPKINDTSSNHTYNLAVSELTANRTVTLPLLTTNDEFVFADHAKELKNKTISGGNNTLSNIGNSSLTNSSITFGSTAQALGSTVSALNGVSIGGTTPAAGAFTTLSSTGNTTLGDASGDTLTINGTAVSCPNTLRFENGTSATTVTVGNGTASVSSALNIDGGSSGATGPVIFGKASASNEWLICSLRGAAGAEAGLGGLVDYVYGAYPRVFYTNAAERMRIDSSGNVGIGTKSPSVKLDISNPTAGAPTVLGLSGGNAGAVLGEGATLAFKYSGPAGQVLGAVSGQFNTTGTAGYGRLAFSTRTAEFVTEKMCIDGSGNVGIGTSSPSQKFVIAGGIGEWRFKPDDLAVGSNSDAYSLTFSGGLPATTLSTAGGGKIFLGGNARGDNLASAIAFYRNNVESMRINSSGNVLIGATTDTGYKVQVYAGTSVGANYQLLLTPESGALGRDSAILFGATFSNNWGGADYSARFSGGIQYGASGGTTDPRSWSMRFLVGGGVSGDVPTERMRIDSSGYVGIGTSSPDTSLYVASSGGSQKRAIHVASGDGAGTAGGIYIETNNSSGANGAVFEAIGKRSDGNGSAGFSGITALGHLRTDTAISGAGQVLGSVWFGGNPSGTTTADVRYSASIIGVSDAAWSSSSAMGTALAFYTGTSGLNINATIANPGTERMRIDSSGQCIWKPNGTTSAMTLDASGNLGIGVTPNNSYTACLQLASGITFPATQVASTNANTLDDYEEGTWTPSVGGNATYTIQDAYYVKIGKVVYVTGRLSINVLGTGSASTVSGLPFVAANTYARGILSLGTAQNFGTAFFSLECEVANNTSTFIFIGRTAAGSAAQQATVLTNGSNIQFSGFYFTS